MGNIQDGHLFGYDRNPSKSSEGFERLLNAIENECRRWSEITVNIRGQRMRLEEKRNYIKSQLQETVDNIKKPPAPFQTDSQAQTPRVQAQQEAADCGSGKKLQKDADQTNRLLEEKKQELTDLNQKITSLNNEIRGLKEKNDSLGQLLAAEEKEKSAKLQRLGQDISSLKQKLDTALKERDDFSERNRHLKEENDSLGQLLAAEEKGKSAEIQRLEQDNSSLKQKLETALNERNDYSERLSKIISKKIRENNPDIVDLSDTYRPTKLAEIYKELYDNEWTDAFEALTKADYKEQYAIETLRLTLLDCWTFSQKMLTGIVGKIEDVIKDLIQLGDLGNGDEHKVHLQGRVTTFNPKDRREYEVKDSELRRENLLKRWICKHVSQQEGKGVAEEDLQKRLGDFKVVPEDERKKIARMLVPFVQNTYFMTLMSTVGVPEEIKVFINRCLFFCWIAVAQSPPMCLDNAKPGSPFDQKLYKEYTRRGETVQFLVWPALKLHKDGPFLTKGVAQASGAGTEN